MKLSGYNGPIMHGKEFGIKRMGCQKMQKSLGLW